MTRSAGFLIEATGADISLAELSVLLNDGFEARIGRAVPLMPGAARLLAELAAHQVPTALVSASHRRIIDPSCPRWARELRPDHRRRRGGAHQAAPRPVSAGRRAAGRGPGALRRHRGHRDRGGGGRGRGLPGRRRAVGGADRSRPPRRTVVSSLEEVDLAFLRGLMTERR